MVRGLDKQHRLQRSMVTRVFEGGPEYAAPVVVDQSPTDFATKFVFPEVSAAARPIQIVGPFDGDAGATKVTVGGKEAVVLAESPRRCIAQPDPSCVGQKSITVEDAGKQAQGTIFLPRLTLTAAKTALLRGEKTTMTVRVEGLEGLPATAYPIPVELTNKTPRTIDFPLTTNFGIESKDVVGDTWSRTYTINSLDTGIFSVTGILFAIPLHDAKTAMSIEEFNEWMQAVRVLYTEKLKKLQEEADAEAKRNNGKVNIGLSSNIDRKKKLLQTIDAFSGISDAGEKSVAAVAIDKLLSDEAFFGLAADLITLAADLLGYTEVPMPGIGHLLKGAKAVMKKLPKVVEALEKAEKVYEELDKIKDAKEKLDKAKELKEALDGAKKAVEGAK